MSKYGARKTVFQGITFDSQKEAQRYAELRMLERGKVISDLRRQVKFDLLPAQKIGGKLIERAVTYVADFTYVDKRPGRCVCICTANGKIIYIEDMFAYNKDQRR